jgi:CRISPR/Cas system-associated exonuclease Cas4 (RecB family)
MNPFRTFERWSWSQLAVHRSCPFKAYLQYIERSPQPPMTDDDPRSRGIRMHATMEHFVDGSLNELPKNLEHFIEPATELRALKASGDAEVLLEVDHYLDANWKVAPKEQRWLKWIPDVAVRTPAFSLVIDHKSGRQYGNELVHYAQGELYCIGEWIINPNLDSYDFEDWYLDQKTIVQHSFTPEHLEKSRARLDAEVEKMMNDRIHAPRPSKMNCKYCPFNSKGTGACPVSAV